MSEQELVVNLTLTQNANLKTIWLFDKVNIKVKYQESNAADGQNLSKLTELSQEMKTEFSGANHKS